MLQHAGIHPLSLPPTRQTTTVATEITPFLNTQIPQHQKQNAIPSYQSSYLPRYYQPPSLCVVDNCFIVINNCPFHSYFALLTPIVNRNVKCVIISCSPLIPQMLFLLRSSSPMMNFHSLHSSIQMTNFIYFNTLLLSQFICFVKIIVFIFF